MSKNQTCESLDISGNMIFPEKEGSSESSSNDFELALKDNNTSLINVDVRNTGISLNIRALLRDRQIQVVYLL